MLNNPPKFKTVFLNGNFFSLWLGQICAQFGERLTQMALLGLIYQDSLVSAQEVSKLLFFMILPVFVFSPIAGMFVDNKDRKKTLILSDLVRAGLLFLIPFVYNIFNIQTSHNLYPIYFIVFLIFSASRFFVPAKCAMIPEIMDKDSLRMANSISSTSKMIATVLGFLCGSIIVSYFGPAACFYINGLTFIVSAVSICFVRRKYTAKSIPINKVEKTFKQKISLMIKHIIEGAVEIKKNKNIFFITKIMTVIMAAGGAIFVIFPVFINKQFGAQVNGLGVMVSFLGAGLFLGAVILGKYIKNTNNKSILSFSVTAVTILFIILANLKNIFMAYSVMFFIGVCGIPIIICTETLIQEMVPDKMLGRVYSSLEMIIHAAFLLSMWITGFFGDSASPGFVFSVLSSIFAVIIVIVLFNEKKACFK